jgi:hypothetical protein
MADLGSSLQALLQVPGLQELLNQSITQQRQNQPLQTAVRQQALNMLPNSAFPGTGQPTGGIGAAGLGTRPNLSQIPQANYVTPAPSGIDWAKILPWVLAGLAGVSAARHGSQAGGTSTASGGGGALGNLLKGLFHRNTGTVPGETFPNGIPIDPESPNNVNPNWWDLLPPPTGPDPLPTGTDVTSRVTGYTFPDTGETFPAGGGGTPGYPDDNGDGF